jgi:signal transduction histidine kinase
MFEERDNEGNLHRRFVMRVLTPPFIALLILCIIGLWQLNGLLKRQALNELRRSADTTASSLEHEFDLRETVLKRTGSELFVIKNEYQDSRKKLDQDHTACQTYIRTTRKYQNSPNNSCDPFVGALAARGASLTALEDEYVKVGAQLVKDQNQRINDRLSAFKQFFPETLAVVVINSDKQIVSSALSGAFKESAEPFLPDAQIALSQPVYGRLATVEGYKVGVFAFPITGGSVLAAYDVYNEHFIRETWDRAPLDRRQTLAVIMDSQNNVVYPNVKNADAFKSAGTDLRKQRPAEIKLDNVNHTTIGAPAGVSNWMVVVASPTAALLAPLRDAQLASIIAIGLFMVGFTWIGSFFIQRTLRNIVGLVSGAMVFGSGRLDYKIVLDHADSEFVRLGETMNNMAARIAAAEKEIEEKNKEFISVATHELRAPLTAIIGYLSLFQETYGPKLDKQGKMLLDKVYYGSVRLRDLVNDMLNVARLESGRSEFSMSPMDIKPVIQEVIDTMSVVAKMNNVKIVYVDTNSAHVAADEGRMRIIINNFVSNAIKYNRPGGSVTIQHIQKDHELVTAIADNGLGIPEDQKARMFEKFFRVNHEDRSSVTGTGLGMYIVKQYIEQMGGKLWFESIHGKGTTFYFSLPLVNVRLRTRIKNKVKKIARRASPARKRQNRKLVQHPKINKN